MRRPLCVVCLGLIVLAAVSLFFRDAPPQECAAYYGETVTVTGRIYAKQIKIRDGNPVLEIYLTPDAVVCCEMNGQSAEIPIRENLIAVLDEGETEPFIGETVCLSGRLTENEPAYNPGTFSARDYYENMGVCARVLHARLSGGSRQKAWFKEGMWQLRRYMAGNLEKVMTSSGAAVMQGMLFGEKSAIPEEIRDSYQGAGVMHLLTVSGLHISVIGLSLYALLKRIGLPRSIVTFLSAGCMLLFGELTGMPLSAKRAVFMFLMMLMGKLLGRTYDGLTALMLFAALEAVIQPRNLCYAGFLLSFCSVLGIFLLLPALSPPSPPSHEKALMRLFSLFKKGLLPSVSVVVFTLPIQLWFYFQVPLLSPFVNLLILPFMSVVLLTGLFLAAFAGVLPGFLCLAARLLDLFLQVFADFCDCLSQSSIGLLKSGRPQIWQIVLFYGLLLPVIALQRLQYRYRIGMVIGGLLILTLHLRMGLTVHFLYVGQGDCICMEMPDGSNYLIDGGSSGISGVGEYQIEPFLQYRGINTLEAVFISHSDSDHTNGIEWLISEGSVQIKRLVVPVCAGEDESYERLLALAAEKQIPVLYLAAGMEWDCKDVHFSCLHPAVGERSADGNTLSQVIYVSYGDFSMLLTGDLTEEGERLLLEKWQEKSSNPNAAVRQSDSETAALQPNVFSFLETALPGTGRPQLTLLKVAHHGSGYSSGTDFLQAFRPSLAVISVGQNNPYGHPHEETLERLAAIGTQVFCTDERGAITVFVRKDWIKIRCFQEEME